MAEEIFPALLDAVRQQIASTVTPYVGETFRRLCAGGLAEEEALEQMAICLGDEMQDMALRRREFDEAGYRAALEKLPSAESGSEEP